MQKAISTLAIVFITTISIGFTAVAGEPNLLFRPLAQMRGYETVADDFRGSENNKGLEGITIRQEDGAVFVIKEGKPGLLLHC